MNALRSHLESARWLDQLPAAIEVRGWIFRSAGAPLTGVALRRAGQIVARAPLEPRPDVGAAFPTEPGAARAGFHLCAPWPDLVTPVELVAESTDGAPVVWRTLEPAALPGRGPVLGDFAAWRNARPRPPRRDTAVGARFSILLPVYNPPAALLEACVASILTQEYPHWELCVVDDASTAPHVGPALTAVAARDPRVRLLPRTRNGGISRATRDALAAARGDFVVFVDHDDLLRPWALAEFAHALRGDATLDALYSDEEIISVEGAPVLPYLKPAWSPEFLRGVMYVGHLLAVRTDLAQRLGGPDPAFDGVQDFEFMLRVGEATQRIGHVPEILYSWRQSSASSALQGNAKGDMDARQLAAVQAHLARTGDPRHATALHGHRVRLTAAIAAEQRSLAVRPGPDVIDRLLAAARASDAPLLVVADPADPAPAADLLALANRPDSGVVAPVLVGPDGAVRAAGLTFHAGSAVPLMRGFASQQDGYNGTLRCNREVAAVPPRGGAVRRELVLRHAQAGQTWLEFLAAVRAAGFFHRVCASASCVIAEEIAPLSDRADDRDDFYPTACATDSADYRLAAAPPPIVLHLDAPTEWRTSEPGLIVRGWAHAGGVTLAGVRLRAGAMQVDGVVGLPRPDVLAAVSDSPRTGDSGFEVRIRLPAGHHPLTLEFRRATGAWEPVFTTKLTIPRRVWPEWMRPGRTAERLAFQFPAHPTHAPHTVAPERFPRLAATDLPRLALVTPAFNAGRHLRETITSVLAQSDGVDYVVQDGGSRDGTAEILREFAPRLHAAISAPDAGQTDAIARGFARTTGAPTDLMAWINADDLYLPGALAFVRTYFARHPEVDVLYGHRVLIDEGSREVGRWFLPPHDPHVLRLNDFVPQETLFWRRRVWDQVGGVDPSFQFAMDWDLLLRFQAAGARIVRVPYFLGCFRLHAAQKTSQQLRTRGQAEIDALRMRTWGRKISADELLKDARLRSYLRHSARLQWLWSWGWRGR